MSKELELLQREIDLVNKKIELLEKDRKKPSPSIDPGKITLLVAVIGAAATIIGAIWQWSSELEQKRLENEQALVLKAVENGDLDQSKKNLEFFVEAGFIKDDCGEIMDLVNNEDVGLPMIKAIGSQFRITSPTANDSVFDNTFEVKGTFTGSIPDDQRLWPFVYYNGELYSQTNQLVVSARGEWFSQIVFSLNSSLKHDQIRVVVCLAETAALERLASEFENGNYPKYQQLPTGFQTVDYVDLIKCQPR